MTLLSENIARLLLSTDLVEAPCAIMEAMLQCYWD